VVVFERLVFEVALFDVLLLVCLWTALEMVRAVVLTKLKLKEL